MSIVFADGAIMLLQAKDSDSTIRFGFKPVDGSWRYTSYL